MRILSTLALTAGLASAQNYVQDVFPIWEKHCLGCHASGTTMGSLDLETWEGLQRGGNHGTIVVPGDVKASRLYTMLTGETKPAMPMDGNVLSAREIEVVRKWIASGAPPPSAAEITELRRRATDEQKPKARANRPASQWIASGRAFNARGTRHQWQKHPCTSASHVVSGSYDQPERKNLTRPPTPTAGATGSAVTPFSRLNGNGHSPLMEPGAEAQA